MIVKANTQRISDLQMYYTAQYYLIQKSKKNKIIIVKIYIYIYTNSNRTLPDRKKSLGI